MTFFLFIYMLTKIDELWIINFIIHKLAGGMKQAHKLWGTEVTLILKDVEPAELVDHLCLIPPRPEEKRSAAQPTMESKGVSITRNVTTVSIPPGL